MMDDLVTKTPDESDERFTPRWGISICERLTGDSEVGKALHAVSQSYRPLRKGARGRDWAMDGFKMKAPTWLVVDRNMGINVPE